MSDKELIIRLLEKAEQRTRRNRRFNTIAVTLCLSLLIPVTFKLLDLIFLFRGTTVAVFLGLWAAGTAAWIIFQTRGHHPLDQIAANLDRRADLKDQMKTAYWFIRNPRESDWVEAQIGRTAKQAGRINVDALYPKRVPQTSYIAVGLVILLVGLNFIPLSLNHNWVYLQAAPPFRLSDEEQRSLDATRKLLMEAKAAENAEIAQRIEEIIQDLEQGNISVEEAIKQLQELKQELEQGNLDIANMTNGLEEMSAILRQAAPLEEAAQEMGRGELTKAAEELRGFSKELQDLPPNELKDVAEKFQQASENPKPGLEDLARAFESVSGALQRSDRAAAQSALDRTARELERLMKQIEDQQARNEAGEELGELTDSLQERGEDGDGPSTEGDSEGGPPQEGEPGTMTAGEGGERQPGEAGEQGETGEPGEAGEAADGAETDGAAGQGQGEGQNGKGGTSFGGSKESAPVEGDATSLEVQLKKELLEMLGGAGKEPAKDEAAGERERSKLDYRNVPSELSPAQKDLLNQDRIPWESRQLIKNYFQAVKPQENK
jgi:hypothetical protein